VNSSIASAQCHIASHFDYLETKLTSPKTKQDRIMALPLKYNLRNITVRKSSTLATAFTIGLTVGVFLMVMALARGIDLTLTSSGEPLNVIVLREGSNAELNSSVSREQLNDLIYLDGVEREGDQPLAAAETMTRFINRARG
jgi:putative ABC transport system permease protein